MNDRFPHLGFLLGKIFLPACISASAGIAIANPPEFIQMPRGPTTQLPIVSGKGVLTVAGGPYSKRVTFERGEAPVFSRIVFEGFADGVYQFEFRDIPLEVLEHDTLSPLTSRRYGGDSAPSGGTSIIAGSVTIQNGYAE